MQSTQAIAAIALSPSRASPAQTVRQPAPAAALRAGESGRRERVLMFVLVLLLHGAGFAFLLSLPAGRTSTEAPAIIVNLIPPAAPPATEPGPLRTAAAELPQPAPPEPVPPEPAPPEPAPVEPPPPEPAPAPAPPPKPVPVERKATQAPKPVPKPVQKPPAQKAPAKAAPTAESAPPATPPVEAPQAAVATAPPETLPGPPAPAPSAPVTTPARFDAAYLNNPSPKYPPLARRMQEEGKVLLRVRVSAAGLPQEVQLHQSSGSERLDEAARKSVSQWRFVAARQGDDTIESWVIVPIVFKLEGS